LTHGTHFWLAMAAEPSYVPPMTSPPGLLTAESCCSSISDKRVELVRGVLDGTERIIDSDETLDGEDVVPGFACRLAAIL
jgi:hypothetical protein